MMRLTINAFVVTALSLAELPVLATDLEEVAREGYAVIAETRVEGEFEGCDFDKRINEFYVVPASAAKLRTNRQTP
jgi:hypothetical protein